MLLCTFFFLSCIAHATCTAFIFYSLLHVSDILHMPMKIQTCVLFLKHEIANNLLDFRNKLIMMPLHSSIWYRKRPVLSSQRQLAGVINCHSGYSPSQDTCVRGLTNAHSLADCNFLAAKNTGHAE